MVNFDGTLAVDREQIMSLRLDREGTFPLIEMKTYDVNGTTQIYFGDYEIDMEDFLAAAIYVLTNTNLGPDDPRRKFLELAVKLEEKPGFTQVVAGVTAATVRLGFPDE